MISTLQDQSLGHQLILHDPPQLTLTNRYILKHKIQIYFVRL